MRRLARHAFTALAALSLLLCVAVSVLWAWGHWTSGLVLVANLPGGMTVDVDVGHDATFWVRWTRTSPPRAFGMTTDYSIRLPGYQHRGGRTAHGPWFQCLASARLAVVFAVPPGVWVWRWVSRRQRDRTRPGGFPVAHAREQRDATPGLTPLVRLRPPRQSGAAPRVRGGKSHLKAVVQTLPVPSR